jgi:outer membrane protein OmpA-like peptidoglycan-associated protein
MELGIGTPAPALPTPALEPSPTPVGSVMPSTLAQADNSPQPVPGGVAQPAEAKEAPTPGEALPKPIADPEEESQVRAEVLRRIDLIPALTSKERSHLISQVERARSFSKLAILPFRTGSISPDPVQVDHLLSDLGRPGLQQVLEDPTVVLVMVGYADKQGNSAHNLELSRRRADNVVNILKRRTKIENTMRAVAMGSSDLFDNTNYDRNRAVEIWLVVP